MSKGHANYDNEDRQRYLEELRSELQGRLPKGPFEFTASLDFSDFEPTDDDPPVVRRLKLAVKRDCKYGSASAPYMLIFGLSNNLRSIYDGGGQIQDGGGDE